VIQSGQGSTDHSLHSKPAPAIRLIVSVWRRSRRTVLGVFTEA
jgi:hypothetical protein